MAFIGRDFVKRSAPRCAHCSECGRLIMKGSEELVSLKDGKVQKRVCSENCAADFDTRFWENAATKNAARRKR